MSDITKKLYLETHGKSYTIEIISAVLCGPLGIVYSNVWASVFLILVTILMSAINPMLGLFGWGVSILAAGPLVSKHNKKVLATAMLLDRGV